MCGHSIRGLHFFCHRHRNICSYPNALTHSPPVRSVYATLGPTTHRDTQIPNLDEPQQLLQHSLPEHPLRCEQRKLVWKRVSECQRGPAISQGEQTSAFPHRGMGPPPDIVRLGYEVRSCERMCNCHNQFPRVGRERDSPGLWHPPTQPGSGGGAGPGSRAREQGQGAGGPGGAHLSGCTAPACRTRRWCRCRCDPLAGGRAAGRAAPAAGTAARRAPGGRRRSAAPRRRAWRAWRASGSCGQRWAPAARLPRARQSRHFPPKPAFPPSGAEGRAGRSGTTATSSLARPLPFPLPLPVPRGARRSRAGRARSCSP